jgi:DNA-binding NarL/FixJ family response regulator
VTRPLKIVIALLHTGRMGSTSPDRTGPVRVVVVDDHRLFAQALAAVLEADDDLEVVGLAGSIAEVTKTLRDQHVDVVLLDYRLPDASGLDGLAAIRASAPHAMVVMVTATNDERVLLDAVEAGCAGFVLKTGDLSEVKNAVKRAAVGEATIAPGLLSRLLRQLAHRETGAGAGLTPRELEILTAIASGRTNADIAGSLFLSVHTVRNHVQSILAKLGAHSKLEAAAIAVREGLVDLSR